MDFDRLAAESFRANFPDVPVWEKDIAFLSGKEILDFCGLEAGELDVLDGSPPCQGFSTAGKRDVSDPRNDLVLHFLRLVNEIRPKAFIMENVPGMVAGKMKGLFKEYMAEMERLGYSVKCKMLNAANYGVPQSRRRLFWVGIRQDIGVEFSFPKPDGRVVTVRKALYGCPDDEIVRPEGKALWIAVRLRPGMTGSDIVRGRFYNLIRLRWDRPSPTVTATVRRSQCGLLHPEENRFLTIAELKRVSSFPDNFKLFGRFEDRWRLVGNAVMPRQMLAVASALKKAFQK